MSLVAGHIPLAPGAAELAVPLSIAVRIEPELVRAIRLAILPYLDVAAESDLWFSDLVGSRGPDSIMLRPELLPGLRAQLAERLARSAPGDPIRKTGDITAGIHASVSPALLLEERVAWLAASRGDDAGPAIEDELRTALYALQVQHRVGVADWVAGAWGRLPESARGTKTAWQLRQAASLHVDMTGQPLGVVPAGIGVADLAGFTADLADVPLGVRLTGGELELGDIGAPPGAAAVPTLDTDPRIVELLADGDRAGQTIAVPRGGRLSLAVGPGPARLLTPRGLVYQVAPYTENYALVPLRGSERQALPDARPGEPLDGTTSIEITLILRRRADLPPEYTDGRATLTRDDLAARYGADQADIALVRDVLSRRGLSVTETDGPSRRMHVAGGLSVLSSAFGVSLRQVSSQPLPRAAPVAHRYREGPILLPAELDGIVLAVLGLDDRPQARRCVREAETLPAAEAEVAVETPAGPSGQAFTPRQAAAYYEFPQGADGSGQTLAIVDLAGGYAPDDLDKYLSGYFASLGIVPPAIAAVAVDGAQAPPQPEPSPDDALVSIAVAAVLAPGAAHQVYFAANTDRGLLEAVSAAVYASPAPTAVCIGWGQPESLWTAQARAAFDAVLADAAALGVTVCVAAGDDGSGAGQQDGQAYTYFPASSPHALACGGTSLSADPATGTVFPETVWNSFLDGTTGGGVSDTFPPPPWQAGAGVPVHADGGHAGRGVPDVAANADPATGYAVLVAGRELVYGGTAAAAALWAALVCLLAQASGQRFGLLQPLIYAGAAPGVSPAGFRDITTGSNGAYQAGPGWDACTGLGVPVGAELLRLLAGQTA